jgi:hypothetical protein
MKAQTIVQLFGSLCHANMHLQSEDIDGTGANMRKRGLNVFRD